MQDNCTTKPRRIRTRPPIELVCDVCGKTFRTHPYRLQNGRTPHCSKECGGKARAPMARAPLAERFWPHIDKNGPVVRPDLGPCWVWTGCTNHYGYGTIKMPNGTHEGYTEKCHRIAWELTYGPIPDGLWVLHKCDNPPCCRPDHLFLGTRTDNVRDMFAKGRCRRYKGEEHQNATMTDAQVVELRQRHAKGEACAAMAREFGLTANAVVLAVRGKTWKHLPLPDHPQPTSP